MSLLDRKALHDTPVITGWFGEGKDGQLALLSRGGSDHTATSIGRLVDANRVILWKDVQGILPLNPRWGISTQPVAYLGYGEAMELSRLDTPILHPATVEPLAGTGIPLEIRHLHGPNDQAAATVVGPDVYEKKAIKAIGCLPSVVSIQSQTKSLEQQSGRLGEVLVEMSEADISCWHLDTQPGEIRWIVSQHDAITAQAVVERHFGSTKMETYTAIVSLVGNREGANSGGFTSSDIEHLEIEILSQAEHAVRLLTKTQNLVGLLQNLSQRYELKHTLQTSD